MNGSTEYFYDPIQSELLYLHRVTTYPLETIYHRHDAYEIYLFNSRQCQLLCGEPMLSSGAGGFAYHVS